MPEVSVSTHHRRGRFKVFEDSLTEKMNSIGDVISFSEIAPPDWLQDEGLNEWRRIVNSLSNVKLLTAVDANLLAVYCDTFAQWLDIKRTLEAEGRTIASKTNPTSCKASPLFAMQLKLARDLMALSKHFGFSPLTRQNIRLPKAENDEQKEKDSLDQF